MENQFAETIHDFFKKQDKNTRLGILEYYSHDPPNQMYLLWAASHDPQLSENAQRASVLLDHFFLTNKNNYISFELAHRQAAKLFKRLYLKRNDRDPMGNRKTHWIAASRNEEHTGTYPKAPVKNK